MVTHACLHTIVTPSVFKTKAHHAYSTDVAVAFFLHRVSLCG